MAAGRRCTGGLGQLHLCPKGGLHAWQQVGAGATGWGSCTCIPKGAWQRVGAGAGGSDSGSWVPKGDVYSRGSKLALGRGARMPASVSQKGTTTMAGGRRWGGGGGGGGTVATS